MEAAAGNFPHVTLGGIPNLGFVPVLEHAIAKHLRPEHSLPVDETLPKHSLTGISYLHHTILRDSVEKWSQNWWLWYCCCVDIRCTVLYPDKGSVLGAQGVGLARAHLLGINPITAMTETHLLQGFKSARL